MRAPLVVLRLLPLVLSLLRDRRRLLWWGLPARRSEAFHARRAARLVKTVGELGPTFVKLAQLFAGRADVIPEPYVSALSTLTDRVPPIPWAAVDRTIRDAYDGRGVEELFERFDRVPVAAASLGQVHRARWRGQEVAVKVLRPGVERLVAADVRIARRLARWLRRRWPGNMHLRALEGVVEEFAQRIGEELDFRREAEQARAVRRNFAGSPLVRIPTVMDEMVRQRVLVLEFMEGRRIDALDPGSTDAARLVTRVVELYVRMMLVDGLFHADPHPGNLLVDAHGRVILLDFGMVVAVAPRMRRQLVETVFAAIRSDVDGIVDGFYALGLVEAGVSRDRIRPLVELLLSVARAHTTARERADLLAAEVVALLFDWPIVLPREMVYFARTAMLIEGLGTRYDTRFNAIAVASPVALRLRPLIARGLRAAGEPVPAVLDDAALVGETLGRAARIVHDAGRALAALFGGEWRQTVRATRSPAATSPAEG